MIKEPVNINFYTTGKQPSSQDFMLVSEWIKKGKQKQVLKNKRKFARSKVSALTVNNEM